ncbi:hypothetical protein [Sulfurimonas sp.]
MPLFKTLCFISLLLFVSGCSDDATITKSPSDLQDVNCMRLVLFPPNKLFTQTLTQLYNFDENCSYRLEASQKSSIVCNSNQNADKKALSNFPSGYIRLDLYKGYKSIYSYYKDLTHRVEKEDIQKAFDNLKSNIK